MVGEPRSLAEVCSAAGVRPVVVPGVPEIGEVYFADEGSHGLRTASAGMREVESWW